MSVIRETDLEMVKYFKEKYNPFQSKVIANTHGHACDFCHNTHAPKIVKVHSVHANKDLYVCLACEALTEIVGAQAAGMLFLDAMVVESGLMQCDDPEFQAAESEGKKVEEFLKTLPKPVANANDTLEVVELAAKNQLAGHGGWKAVPDIIKQYHERRTLTVRQVDALRKYNKSCEKK